MPMSVVILKAVSSNLSYFKKLTLFFIVTALKVLLDGKNKY